MPKNIDFILEIHIYFKYFYGSNLKGRLQSLFMQKPKLTLYRTKSDMIEAKDAGFKDVGYVYNFFENKNIKPNKKLGGVVAWLYLKCMSKVMEKN